MDILNNPYSPGAGRVPVMLAGRDNEINLWNSSLIQLEKGRTTRPLALYGLRGVGKTVLLNKMYKAALDRGWYVALIEVAEGKSLREQVAFAFDDLLRKLASPKAGKKIIKALKTILNFKASLGILGNYSLEVDLGDEKGSFVSSGIIENDLVSLIEVLLDAAEENNVGVSLLIDETQELSSKDLGALSYLSHYFTQRERAFTSAITGLPTLPSILATAKSYAERLYSYHLIDKLTISAANDAIILPAKQEDTEWSKSAVESIIFHSECYPYFLQEFCANAWNVAKNRKIEVEDVECSYKVALAGLDLGFYKSRWDRATDTQKRYMKVMAEDNDNISLTSEIAKKLGLKIASTSPYREELIRKGLVYSPNHGEIAFTVPKMSEFVMRQEVN